MTATLVNPKTGAAHRLVTRAEWRAGAPRARYALASTDDGTFDHWAVVKPTTTIKAGSAVMRAIQSYHRDTLGWFDFAYSFAYDDAGNIFEGRGWGIANGATTGFGSSSHAFVYLGGALKPDGSGERYQPTDRALEALFALEAHEDALYGAGKPIRPHLRVAATGCPGPVVTGYVEGPLLRLLDTPTPGAPEKPLPAPDACRYQHQGDRALRRGLVGKDVAEWQFLLNVANGPDRSHWLAVDGDFGPATEKETRRLQSIYRFFFDPITVDGIVGPDTRRALCDVLRVRGAW